MPRSANRDSVNRLLGMTYPPRLRYMPPMPKSPSSYSLVIQTMSALSRTCRARSSNSRLTAYSNAAPSQVQVPCPTPTRKRCRSPRRIRSAASSSGGLHGVPDRAHRPAVAVRAEPFGLVKTQPRPGGVDQEVVRYLLTGSRGGLDDDVGPRARGVAFGVNLPGPGLPELDAVVLVDRRERERHLARSHPAHAHPDVGRDPVVSLVRRDDRHGVVLAEPFPCIGRGSMPGDARAEYHHAAHRRLPIAVRMA